MVRLNPNDRFAKHPTPIERPPPPPPPPGVATGGKGSGGGGERTPRPASTSSSSSLSSSSSSSSESLTPSTPSSFEYEFGGPLGAFLTMVSLPIVTLLLIRWAARGRIVWEDVDVVRLLLASPSCPSSRFLHFLCPSCDDGPLVELPRCALVVFSWFAFQVILERVLPCELVEGAPLPDRHGGGRGGEERRLTYRINGHLAFWVTLMLLDVGWPRWIDVVVEGGAKAATTTTTGRGGPWPWPWSRRVPLTGGGRTTATRSVLTLGRAPLAWLYDHHAMLAFVTIAYAICLSTYLYAKSFALDDGDGDGDGGEGARRPPLLAAGGNSGNRVYDFFMGRELNPRSLGGTFDWKEFCELRPGLIGWAVLNMAMLAKQRDRLGYVTGSMVLVNVFQGAYVWDALYQERAILTTMDITTDGFGYMLVFGDLAWVPFTYSLQARYLVDHDPLLSLPALAGIVAVNVAGYLIFRGANGQKDAFRRDPNSVEVSHLTYLRTKRGTKLLTSGWWGLARKINYTGDWIMGLSWCMLCGFDSVVPYFYAIYFAILLVHRSVRDDRLCREKYGDDWDRYKSIVPYRFIPGII
ncbi:hypothetical protein ACHAW5_001049 [Stephanodiscus triporus]|uniref:Delta(14)-sterol reductase ERG24 n=1 Tax=Stephanodiscus triporus TaxID=2934178 RepID=A0ABD3MN50_9STRA